MSLPEPSPPIGRSIRPGRASHAGRVAILFGAGVLAVSLAVVVGQLGTAALWRLRAHESEARSLLRTIWFPAHALRELPHLALLAFVWCFAWRPPRDARAVARGGAILVAVGATALVLLFAAAASEESVANALRDLAQSRVAPGLEGPGVHFEFHLASDVAVGAVLFVAARVLSAENASGRWPVWLIPTTAAAVLAAGAAHWGTAAAATPRAVGHAAREVETQLVVALPFLVALALARSPWAPGRWRTRLRERPVRAAIVVAVAAIATLALGMRHVELSRDASDPDRPISLNLAVHHFEHVVDAAFLVVAAAAFARRSSTGKDAAR